MSLVPPQYEFTPDQNRLVGGLAHKMGWVGLFFLVVGLLNLLAAVLLILAASRNQIPAEWLAKVPADLKSQLEQLPGRNQLWALALNGAVSGLINLLIGVYTRSAARSFQLIVDTQGADVTHLVNALGALNKKYTLLYTLLVVAVLAFIVLLVLSFLAAK